MVLKIYLTIYKITSLTIGTTLLRSGKVKNYSYLKATV